MVVKQSSVLAAAGAEVTVVDLCPGQLEKDRELCDQHGLKIQLVHSPADDLGQIESASQGFYCEPGIKHVFSRFGSCLEGVCPSLKARWIPYVLF